MTRYIAEPNHCRCHPETCCCKDYQVRDTHGKEPKITVFDLDEAQQLAKSLNRAALSLSQEPPCPPTSDSGHPT